MSDKYIDIFSKLNEIEKFEWIESKKDLKKESLESLKRSEILADREKINLILVALDEKPCAGITLKLESDKELEKFINLVNNLGVNLAYKKAEEKTIIGVEAFATKKNLSASYFEDLKDLGTDNLEYHEKLGNLFGISDEDIEAFIENQGKEQGKTEEALNSVKAWERIGEEFDISKTVFKALNFRKINNDRESLRKAGKRVRKYRDALEKAEKEFNLDLTSLLETAVYND